MRLRRLSPEGVGRSDVYDRPPAAVGHVTGGRLSCQEGARNVDGECPRPVLLGYLENRRIRHHRRVVHQHVEMSESFNGDVHDPLRLGGDSHIGDMYRDTLLVPELGADGFQSGLVAGDRHHPCTLGVESVEDGAPDALRSPRDDHVAVAKPRCRCCHDRPRGEPGPASRGSVALPRTATSSVESRLCIARAAPFMPAASTSYLLSEPEHHARVSDIVGPRLNRTSSRVS